MDDFDELVDTSYQDRMVTTPNALVGMPTVKGNRISDELNLDFIASELDLDELFAAYPRLTTDDVKAALVYARADVVGAEIVPRSLTGVASSRGQ